MPYFADHYDQIAYPIAAAPGLGLYNAQIGAIHAIASHFTVDERAAIVTMPTGSGKTAVLMMTPFVLKSSRPLVITPSRLVRGQIAEDFKLLATLREIGVLPAAVQLPRVLELEKRIENLADWEALREYDVVVSTPNCTSPTYAGVPLPPEDLFDLVLIDEAHHSAASTWTGLLDSMPKVRRALFTATPFRRDRGEIQGRFVYSYPIARAFHDGIFGRIAYLPTEPVAGESNDIAVARRAEAVFQADRQAGLNHYVMVRTDRRTRAEALEQIYAANTALRLKVVHSALSNRYVKRVLEELSRGELDGVICVNMMGEGFNFPNLKIAAIHAPHRSLEVTLQFIGRFARTNSPDIGEAKFIAVPSEIEIEGRRLFEEGKVWQEIVPDLSHGRIAAEIRVREALQEFDEPEATEATLEDLSLYSLYPRSHVKIYDVSDGLDLRTTQLVFPAEIEVCYRNLNTAGTVLVIITRQRGRPKWSSGDEILNLGYDLFVVYHDRQLRLLFINSSRSVDGTYELIARTLDPEARPLATGQVGRVVRGINNQRVFNIGMRNIQAANSAESYKIIAGSDTQATITPADARRYRQGHVYLSGEEGGERTTIGYSSGSKVWAAANGQIPDLLEWCRALGAKIRTATPIVTHSGLDYLDAGTVVNAIPDNITFVQWDKDAFDLDPPVQIEFTKDDGTIGRGHILDLDLTVDRGQTNQNRIRVLASADGISVPVTFTLDQFYTMAAADQRITVSHGTQTMTLVEYLNESNLDFYTADGALFRGNELFAAKEAAQPIDAAQISAWDWAGVDIQREVTASDQGRSVHQEVAARLIASGAQIVLYDHGSGEVADYITMTEGPNDILFGFYHCKGSGAPMAGARVDDGYEVCGQAQKSVAWTSITRLDRRLRLRRGKTQFLKGTENELRALLDRAREVRHRFQVFVVQPGISKAQLSAAMAENLGATNTHLVGIGVMPLEVIASA